MKLYLFEDDKIIIFNLPMENVGNFWMTDSLGNNIVNIKSENGKWILSGSEITKISNLKGDNENIILMVRTYYLVEKEDKKYVLFSEFSDDLTFVSYRVNENDNISIGKNATCDICCDLPFMQPNPINISFNNSTWSIKINDNNLFYLNNKAINDAVYSANNGDVINIYGLKILLACGMVFINNPFNNIKISSKLQTIELLVSDSITEEEIINKDLYEEDDYFLRSPRLRKTIEKYETSVDSPPAQEKLAETPLWVTLAPMLTMAATSVISLTNILSSVADGTKTFKQSIPSLIIAVSMLLTILVWPFLTKKFEKKKKIEKENERQEKYKEYLEKKRQELIKEYDTQKKTLEDSLIPTNVCYDAIINKRRTLWERKIDQGDFLTVRVGRGSIPFDANVRFHVEEFTMNDDNLKKSAEELVNQFKIIEDVPIGYSFADNKFTAIAGMSNNYVPFVNNVLLQMMAFHSYDNLKFVIFTSNKNKDRWQYLKKSPYCFSNEKDIRFFATNEEEMQSISEYLSQVFNNRKILATSGNHGEKITNYSGFNCYYLFIIDNIDDARDIDILNNMLDYPGNLGFGSIIIEERLSKLPSEVNSIITVSEKVSVIIQNDTNNQVRFNNEIVDKYNIQACVDELSNLPVFVDDKQKVLPNMVSFLEMFSVGQVDQLNILNRWKANDPIKSLKTEVGINENEGLFYLDIHEKQHGPHGLIAGMTGSGKSEFIISYILSMAINYSPEEVAFVLIDYKGGGLANAFVDSETGRKLPHVVGTITNLDKSEINRALSSIKSELTRRQTKFNEIKDQTGESTIDIYKYQKLYRDGVINEPMPHLIIVSDEFAELKEQQPDFMDDLVSTARIGRSLGVHLILATQKPTGVVSAQIWSNSKFKVCLKVQDKSDSMEMIKSELAAELKNVGRFYLQVGYNEYFALGQSAWAGAKYYPNKEFKKPVDKNLYIIDNIGSIEKAINNSIAKSKIVAQGEELSSILKYIIETANTKQLNIKQLWKDSLSDIVLIDDLIKKYKYIPEEYVINPIIGEYDDPTNQTQGLLTLPISDEGNTLIYGMGESGKDELLQTIIYSIITNHSSEEVNLYLADFGSETLINFNNAPQVGDVIFSSDEEKLNNFVKLLNTELTKRKKLFTKYNGNYKDFLRLSGKKLPCVIVVINAIEVINELYFDFTDKFVTTVREGSKYGIYYIITTENQNSIKMKISQCCKQLLCLQLSNETAYKDILGKTDGVVPSSFIGRGLVKKEKVCEFQSAIYASPDDRYNTENKLIDELNKKNMKKAMAVPIMPDIIKSVDFENKYLDVTNVPVGITKEALLPSLYDFSKNVATIISSNELDNMKQFLINLLKLLESKDTFNKIVIDANNFFEEFNYRMPYTNKDFEKCIDALNNQNESITKVFRDSNNNINSIKALKNTLCVIIGFNKFYDKLSDDYKSKFTKLLNDSKEILKVTFIFVDIPAGFKKFEYDEWYKSNVNANDGIWIGQGLTQQYVLKSSVQLTSYSSIDNDHGIVLKSSVPVIVKLINEIKISKD